MLRWALLLLDQVGHLATVPCGPVDRHLAGLFAPVDLLVVDLLVVDLLLWPVADRLRVQQASQPDVDLNRLGPKEEERSVRDAASGSSPTARTWRPKIVREETHQAMGTSATATHVYQLW